MEGGLQAFLYCGELKKAKILKYGNKKWRIVKLAMNIPKYGRHAIAYLVEALLLKAVRSGVRFFMSLQFSIDLILPASLWL
jgi:hypothetical protein